MDPSLRTWKAMNRALMNGGERKAEQLFTAEMKGLRRPTYLRRIHSRINSLRAMRERRAIEKATASHNRLRDARHRTTT